MASKANDPMVMAILAKHKPPEMGGEAGEEEGNDSEAGMQTAAEEALAAIEKKDAAALAAALKNFWMIADAQEPHAEAEHTEE